MPNIKLIKMRYNSATITASISSEMTDAEIYRELHTAFINTVGSYHIVIIDPYRNILATLAYTELKEGTVYIITTSAERIQGAGTASRASKTTLANLAIVMQDWRLAHAGQIFPVDIAPRTVNAEGKQPLLGDLQHTGLLEPELWSARFTSELRRLSRRSQGMHVEIMHLVRWEIEGRHEREESPVKYVTTIDLKNTVQHSETEQTEIA